MVDGISLKLAVGGMQSIHVRSFTPDGREVGCLICGTTRVHWDHIWSCCLGMAPPDDVLLRRFLWPRSCDHFPLCHRFLEAAHLFTSLYNA